MTIDFAKRKSFLGASDAPIVMGVSPWKTQYELWQDKLDLLPPEKENWAMRRGNEQEPIAREAYISMTGNVVAPKCVYHPEISFMLANLDGITSCGSKAVEIKNPGEADHAKAKDGKIPDKYYPQLQQQLEIMHLLFDVTSMDYFSYRNGDSALIEIEWDEKYTKNLCSESKKFWKYVETLTPPPMTNRDYIKRPDDPWVMASSIWVKKKEVLDQAKVVYDQAKQEEVDARNHLIKLTDGKSSMGNGVKALKYFRKGSVDYTAIPQLKEVDLDPYRKSSSEIWKLTEF